MEDVNWSIFQDELCIVRAMYCAGYERLEVKDKLKKILSSTKMNDYGAYDDYLALLSLCILLNVDSSFARIIIKSFDREFNRDLFDGEKDAVFEFLSSHFDKSLVIRDHIHFPKPYGRLLDLIHGREEEPTEALKIYLSNWYRSNQGEPWAGSHNREGYFYTGYWSFESAAIVKMMKLDETEFVGTKYYPFDLVKTS